MLLSALVQTCPLLKQCILLGFTSLGCTKGHSTFEMSWLMGYIYDSHERYRLIAFRWDCHQIYFLYEIDLFMNRIVQNVHESDFPSDVQHWMVTLYEPVQCFAPLVVVGQESMRMEDEEIRLHITILTDSKGNRFRMLHDWDQPSTWHTSVPIPSSHYQIISIPCRMVLFLTNAAHFILFYYQSEPCFSHPISWHPSRSIICNVWQPAAHCQNTALFDYETLLPKLLYEDTKGTRILDYETECLGVNENNLWLKWSVVSGNRTEKLTTQYLGSIDLMSGKVTVWFGMEEFTRPLKTIMKRSLEMYCLTNSQALDTGESLSSLKHPNAPIEIMK